jgi:hypothetical protein
MTSSSVGSCFKLFYMNIKILILVLFEVFFFLLFWWLHILNLWDIWVSKFGSLLRYVLRSPDFRSCYPYPILRRISSLTTLIIIIQCRMDWILSNSFSCLQFHIYEIWYQVFVSWGRFIIIIYLMGSFHHEIWIGS